MDRIRLLIKKKLTPQWIVRGKPVLRLSFLFPQQVAEEPFLLMPRIGGALFRDPDQHHRDIVVTPALIGLRHQVFSGRLQRIARQDQAQDLVVPDQIGQPVRAEQQRIARA